MPILENAKKALRGSKRKAIYNQTVKSRIKNAVDSLRDNPTMENLTAAYSAIDKGVKKNIYHQNKAAHLKSQLSRLVKPTKLVKKVAKPTKKATKPKKAAAKSKTVKKTVAKKPAKKAPKK